MNSIDFGTHRSKVKVTMGVIEYRGNVGCAGMLRFALYFFNLLWPEASVLHKYLGRKGTVYMLPGRDHFDSPGLFVAPGKQICTFGITLSVVALSW